MARGAFKRVKAIKIEWIVGTSKRKVGNAQRRRTMGLTIVRSPELLRRRGTAKPMRLKSNGQVKM
jgi:hypothetical protein